MPAKWTSSGAVPASFLLPMHVLRAELRKLLAAHVLDAEQHGLLHKPPLHPFHKAPRVTRDVAAWTQRRITGNQPTCCQVLTTSFAFLLLLLRVPYRRFEPRLLCRPSRAVVREDSIRGRRRICVEARPCSFPRGGFCGERRQQVVACSSCEGWPQCLVAQALLPVRFSPRDKSPENQSKGHRYQSSVRLWLAPYRSVEPAHRREKGAQASACATESARSAPILRTWDVNVAPGTARHLGLRGWAPARRLLGPVVGLNRTLSFPLGRPLMRNRASGSRKRLEPWAPSRRSRRPLSIFRLASPRPSSERCARRRSYRCYWRANGCVPR